MTVDDSAARRRVALLAVFALVCALAPPSIAQEASEQTALSVEQPSLELGNVVAGETVTATFVFHNNGPDDVHIIRAKPS